MDKAVIFLNGDKSDFSGVKKYLQKNTLIIGCDGGTDKILELGRKPDAVVGDFDSFDSGSLGGETELARHPKDKDYTDSEAAIAYAIGKGAEQIIITGLSGSRTDHLLGNIFLLDKPDFAGCDIKIIEGKQEIYLIRGKAVVNGKKGNIISFIPLFGEVEAISSSGLKYSLEKYTLSTQGNTGISNELKSSRAEIFLHGGDKLLVIHERSGGF